MHRPFLLSFGVLILVFLAFGQSLWHGYAPMDDSFLIVNNLAVRGPTLHNLYTVFTTYDPELYIPLTFVSYQLNYLIGGLEPFWFHLVNLLLHGFNACLVGYLAWLLTRKFPLVLAATALFAAHPLQAEVVVWLSGRKDLLLTLFFLLGAISYIRYRKGSRYAYVCSILCALLALLSKVTAVTLPAVLIAYDLLIERRSISRQFWLDKIPYGCLSVLFAVIASGGKERIISNSTLWETLLMACRSLLFYLQSFVWPMHLSVIYEYHGDITLLNGDFLIPFVCAIVVVVGIVQLILRAPRLAFACLWFCMIIAPTFFNFRSGGLDSFASDRYAYLPLVGLVLGAVIVGSILVDRWHLSTTFTRCTAVLIISFVCLLSYNQTAVWASAESLLQHSLAHYPDSVMARTSLAKIYRENGQLQEAFDLLKEGLQYGNDVRLYLGAGYVLSASGRIEDAEAQFRNAIEFMPDHPEAYFSLGSLYRKTGRRQQSYSLFKKAVALDDSYVIARVALAEELLHQGDGEGAQAQFKEALAWNHSSAEARLGLVRIAVQQEDAHEAKRLIDEVLSIDPHHKEALRIQKDLNQE